MEIIQFRVWDTQNKKFQFPDDINDLFGGFVSNRKTNNTAEFILFDLSERYTISQFTGLTDRFDKDIYEGDIVKGIHKQNNPANYKIQDDVEEIGVITYHHSYFALGNYKLFIFEGNLLEVVGNIYQNPELIQQ